MATTLLTLALLLFHASAWGAQTYYASPSAPVGNTCPGAISPGTPVRGLNAGISCLAGGDTLVLDDGLYTECVNDTVPSGSAGQPTTIRAKNPPASLTATRTVRINGHATDPNGCSSAIIKLGTNGGSARAYITLDGLWLEIQPGRVATAFVGYGGATQSDGAQFLSLLNMEMSGGVDTGEIGDFSLMISQPGNGHDLTVRGTYLHDFGLVRRASPGPQGCSTYAMYISGWNNVFENNEITHGCGFGIHGYSNGPPAGHFYNNIIRNNYFHDMGAAAVMICGSPSANYVYNNIIARTGVQMGGAPASGSQQGGITTGPNCGGTQPNNNFIYNNTFIYAGGNGELRCIALSTAGNISSNNNTVKNNVCAFTQPSSSEGLSNTSGGTGNVFAQNLCTSSGPNCAIVNASPQFVTTMPSPSTNFRTAGIRPADFQLQPGSPAIGVGQCDQDSMKSAFDGQTRPQPTTSSCDLGAWEMGGGSIDILPPILKLYWRLDESSGSTAADATGNGYTGTLTGAPLPVHTGGRVGPQGLSVSGTGEHVETTTLSLPAGQPVTLVFWVKASSGGGPGLGAPTATPNLFGLCVPCTDNYLYWQYGTWNEPGGGGSMFFNFAPFLDKWTHVAVGGNGSTGGKIWINGQLQVESASGFSAPSGTVTGFEAGRWNKPGHVVNGPGLLDDVRLYTGYLENTDVEALYRTTAGRVRHSAQAR